MKHSRPTRGSNITPYVTDLETGQLVKNDNVMMISLVIKSLLIKTTIYKRVVENNHGW